MTQPVESRRFPYLPLRVELDGLELRLEALIDTGFDGDLALPTHYILCFRLSIAASSQERDS